ncbi:MAG: EthD domain-containing protein [Rhizobiaceae bacterium]|nr:EthD domain-containing protein [Rhizobiaceae bacterium]
MAKKRFILGRFASSPRPDDAKAAATAYASELLKDVDVSRAVYSEAIAKGPRGDGFGFEFLVEAWLPDSTLPAFDTERSVRAARAAGLDPEASRTVLADEKVIKAGTAAVKGTFLSKRRPDSSVEEYQKYWRGNHADVIQAQKDFFAFVRAYVQNHFVPASFVTLSGCALSQEDSFDGSPQMWFDSPDDIYGAFATDGYHKHIKEDEKVLVKVGYSQSFIAREYPIML